ncbi:MAG TPA: hypothetical protein P5348_10385 [Bacteroidales bacterium]|nr:hypothetical protein [Bacteroidales bacterium]
MNFKLRSSGLFAASGTIPLYGAGNEIPASVTLVIPAPFLCGVHISTNRSPLRGWKTQRNHS